MKFFGSKTPFKEGHGTKKSEISLELKSILFLLLLGTGFAGLGIGIIFPMAIGNSKI